MIAQNNYKKIIGRSRKLSRTPLNKLNTNYLTTLVITQAQPDKNISFPSKEEQDHTHLIRTTEARAPSTTTK